MNNPNQKMNIDFKNTTMIEGFDGGLLFGQAFVLRKVSKFVAGTDNDAIMPIPVFYDPTTMKILGEGIPVELREELKDELV